jgi:outer membrane receptor for ferrienterochelin and colicin
LKKIILFISIILQAQLFFGQVITLDNTIVVSGKVVDAETSQPIEYATISFLQAGHDKIVGTTSNENGIFNMEIDAGIYSIKIDFLSYQTHKFSRKLLTKDLDLGIVVLKSGTLLDEVEVIAEKKLLEFEINKRIYNASADIANRGGNGLDVLGNTPSVRVDAEGSINVRGSNATILIDGKPQFNINNTDFLKSLPSNSIDKVEIITRSAKYSAEGGGAIVNIITKKSKNSGFSGSFEAHTGIPDNHGFSTFLNKTTKKINLYSTISYVNENRIKETNFKQPLLDLFQDIEEDRLRNTILFNIGSDFYLNDKSTLSTSVLLNNNNKNNTFKITENDFNRKTDDADDILKYEANLGYVTKLDTLGQQLSVDFKYEQTTAETVDAILETPAGSSPEIIQQSFKNQDLHNFLAQLDYKLPFTENKNLEVGYKGTFRNYQNVFNVSQFDTDLNDFSTINNLDDTFNYRENVHAIYGVYNATHGDFSYAVGLRAEITDITKEEVNKNTLDTKNYTDLFPSLTLAYEISDDSFLSLSYSRAIDRPSIPQLNPFISFADERFQSVGNQNLNTYYTNYFELLFYKSFVKLNF